MNIWQVAAGDGSRDYAFFWGRSSHFHILGGWWSAFGGRSADLLSEACWISERQNEEAGGV